MVSKLSGPDMVTVPVGAGELSGALTAPGALTLSTLSGHGRGFQLSCQDGKQS